jgi:hypothetical protein
MKYTDLVKKIHDSHDKIHRTAETRVDDEYIDINQKTCILRFLENTFPQLETINPILDQDFEKKLETATQAAAGKFFRDCAWGSKFESSNPEFQFLLELITHIRALLVPIISKRFFVKVYKAANNDFLGFVFQNKFVMNYLACLMGGIPQVFEVEEKKSAQTHFKDMFKNNPKAHAMRTFAGNQGQEKTLYVAAHVDEKTGNLYPVFKNENILKIFYQFFKWNLNQEAIKPTYLILHHPELFPGFLSKVSGTKKGESISVLLRDPTLGCDKNENMMTHISLFRILPSPLINLVVDYEPKHGCANCSP